MVCLILGGISNVVVAIGYGLGLFYAHRKAWRRARARVKVRVRYPYLRAPRPLAVTLTQLPPQEARKLTWHLLWATAGVYVFAIFWYGWKMRGHTSASGQSDATPTPAPDRNPNFMITPNLDLIVTHLIPNLNPSPNSKKPRLCPAARH